MSVEIPTNTPEKKEILDDNARKFTLDALDDAYLNEHNASSFVLTIDWLETEEATEKKVAYKQFSTGDVQIVLIAKATEDGNRTTTKERISEEEYTALVAASVLHLEKKRYEFEHTQNGTVFSMKYDEFTGSNLRILEVDADDEATRNAFDPQNFPSSLHEVTGDVKYYGYRVATVL